MNSVSPRAAFALRHLRTGIGIALVLALVACRNDSAEQQAPPPPQVTVVTVQPRDVPVVWHFVGQTAGFRDVEVRARVTGIVLKHTYTEGSFVKKGDPLFQIDPAPFKAVVDQQKAAVAQAKATLNNDRRYVARLKPLAKSGATSRKRLDDAISAAQVAKADLQAAQAQLQQAQINLGYTHVDAPISGLSGKAALSDGSLAIAGQNSLLTTISQVDPIYVYFSFADNDYLKLTKEIAAGRVKPPPNNEYEVELHLGDGSTFANKGKIDFKNNSVDPNTGTIQARAEFPNPDKQLVPNQFVRVIVKGAVRPDAILIPQRAVMQTQKGQLVYVVDKDGKAQERPVEVGQWIGTDWLINKGLKAGDRVIVDGVTKVRPDKPVKITPAQAPAKDAATPAAEK